MTEDRMSFGARLRQARAQAGLSQHALAAQAGISASYVSRLEHDGRRPSWPVVRALTLALPAAEAAALFRAARYLPPAEEASA